jgi:zinc/manganese transport system permease protein
MLSHEFVRNAYLAGTLIAIACGFTGWFLVLRGQVFAADALTHVAFVGAIAAAVVGVDERVGLLALTLAAAAGMAALGRRAHADDVAIGTFFSWILGLGLLFLTLLSTSSAGGTGIATANTLFGSIYSLSAGHARVAAAVAAGVAALVVVAFRPLLFSTLDPELAAVRGVSVRAVGVLFLGLLAAITAEGTPAIGALLLLGLIAAPAGAAHQLTDRPYRGLALSGLIAVGSVWCGLALSYAVPSLPPSSAIIGFAAASFGAAAMLSRCGWERSSQSRRRWPSA